MAVAPTADISYLVLSLNTSARAAFVGENRRVLPQLHLFRAVSRDSNYALGASLVTLVLAL